ncbi:hypothetical protein [Salinimicrobium sediminilitoris]|uniref:hypothetical protein n=1 Tax=Salinimicrobium sediminilitoris TaxID=2876715 RepID=UPI001E5A070E|nr:hypothetical protein [Salinimicrobium sediminilitoris]MCC8358449.1 hypothetical protein [Salinimicrobium sediminilitoris]
MLGYDILNIFAVAFILLCGIYYIRKNDEFPFILSIFNYFISIHRFNLIQQGTIDYIRVRYSFNIFNFTDEKAVMAMNYIFIGTTVFIIFYVIFSAAYRKKDVFKKDNPDILSVFIQKNQSKLIIGFFIFFMVNSVMRASISGSLALGNSYFFLFAMAVGGFNLLIALLIISGKLKLSQKIFLSACLTFGIVGSYNPSTRFIFLSWAIGISFLLFRDMNPGRKLKFLVPAGILIVLFFSLLGAERKNKLEDLSWQENLELAFERAATSEDQNMLDGFMMVLDVYPEHLDFHYGLEHLEILMRPIPRSLWPDKPLGGYANKLGLNDVNKGTVGISQTIYGSFYGEGGFLGIIIFSILYAKLFAWLLNLTRSYASDLRFLIKGVIIASLIPLLRGGDIPGIYAFIGMSFWPVFIFIYLYNKFLQKEEWQAELYEEDNLSLGSN